MRNLHSISERHSPARGIEGTARTRASASDFAEQVYGRFLTYNDEPRERAWAIIARWERLVADLTRHLPVRQHGSIAISATREELDLIRRTLDWPTLDRMFGPEGSFLTFRGFPIHLAMNSRAQAHEAWGRIRRELVEFPRTTPE